jgi:hypothetical protein
LTIALPGETVGEAGCERQQPVSSTAAAAPNAIRQFARSQNGSMMAPPHVPASSLAI